ncbi:penicillin-binding protein activator [Iodidimonas gelatinilytica]|nr:penicillin-binding protein activator [Iodidimonas gelatinilytica]
MPDKACKGDLFGFLEKNRMRYLIGTAAFCASLLLSACASGPQSPPSSVPSTDAPKVLYDGPDVKQGQTPIDAPAFEPIRIGLLLPFSGPAADVGTAMRDAAALALFDAYDPRLELLPFDTLGTAQGAQRAAQQALDAGVSIVLGPLLAQSVDAAAGVLRTQNIPLIGFSNDSHVAGDGVYLMGFMPDQDVRRIIAYARSQGHQHMAGLVPHSAYGDRVLESFGPAVLDMGGDLVSLVRYDPDPDLMAEPVKQLARYDSRRAAYLAEVRALEALGDDLSNEILKRLENQETLGEPGFDALLLAEGDPLLRSLGPLLPYYEIDPQRVQFLGTGLWDEPALTREPPLRGAWFPAPDPKAPRDFLKRYETAYGKSGPRIATLAYDGMALIATLARNPLKEERFSAVVLENPAGFTGLDGAFRFGGNGVAQRRLAVLEIRRTGFQVIDSAPSGFQRQRLGRVDFNLKDDS